MDKEYIIYHIPGKKIGVTNDLYNRVERQQGYEVGEYEILESSPDIDYISKRELELQKSYGYRVDLKPYNELSVNLKLKNMKINITEQTTTFPCPLNKLKGRLHDNLEMEWETEHGHCYLDPGLIKWIVANAKTSMFNNDRCYVYNKAMSRFIETSTRKEVEPELFYEQPKDFTTFDLIRSWAKERGLYDKGDSKTQLIKLYEEAGELSQAVLKNNRDDLIDAIGDCVVVLTNLAHLNGVNIETCIGAAYDEISSRTGKMINGTFVKDN